MQEKIMTQDQIMKGLLSGDAEVFRYLDTSYRKKVIDHACTNSGVKEDGEELYNDVVFELYLKAESDKYDKNKTDIESLFMTIVRYRWIDKLRKKRIVITPKPIEDLENEIRQVPGISDEVDDDENSKIRAVLKCITQLKEEEQEMVRLIYYTSQSIGSVANTMNIKYDSAKLKIFRIREKIKKLLIENPDFDLLIDYHYNLPHND